MDLSAIKQQVMFQIGGDAEDVQDFLPYLTRYINEGYDRLVMAACGRHVSDEAVRICAEFFWTKPPAISISS